jgi:hypothetical protein
LTWVHNHRVYLKIDDADVASPSVRPKQTRRELHTEDDEVRIFLAHTNIVTLGEIAQIKDTR